MTGISSNILIVENDFEHLHLMKEMFKNEGYKITTARDGDEGYKHILIKKFDFIIADIYMPKMSGVRFLNRLKICSKNKRTPIFLLSNKSDCQIVRKSMDLNIKNVMEKTSSPKKILEQVKVIVPPFKKTKTYDKSMVNIFISGVTAVLKEYFNEPPKEIKDVVFSAKNVNEYVTAISGVVGNEFNATFSIWANKNFFIKLANTISSEIIEEMDDGLQIELASDICEKMAFEAKKGFEDTKFAMSFSLPIVLRGRQEISTPLIKDDMELHSFEIGGQKFHMNFGVTDVMKGKVA